MWSYQCNGFGQWWVNNWNIILNFIIYIILIDRYYFRDDLFLPENTYNPELQYIYYCIVQKAINKDKPLTKIIPKNIQNFLNPNKNLMEQAKDPINKIKELFSLIPKIDEKYALKCIDSKLLKYLFCFTHLIEKYQRKIL